MATSSKKNTKKSPKKVVKRAARAKPLTEAEKLSKSKEAFLRAFEDVYTITAAARSIGVTRQAVLEWAKDDADFQARMIDLREEKIELVEEEMFEAIMKKKSEPMIMFYLRTQGRKKGYGTTGGEAVATLPSKVTVTVVHARHTEKEPKE